MVLARALLSVRRTDEARPQAERALAEARAAGAPGLEVEALTTAAFLDEVDGDREAAADRLGTALRLARAAGRAGRGAARALLARLPALLQRGRQRVAAGAESRHEPGGGERSSVELPGVELRLLHAVALYVAGDLDGSLQAAAGTGEPAARRRGREARPR